MTIKPVDFQVLVGRAQEVEKVHQIRQQADQTNQQNFLIQHNVQLQRRENQVQKALQTEKGRVERESRQKSYSEQEEEKEKKGSAKKTPPEGQSKKREPAPGSLFDAKM